MKLSNSFIVLLLLLLSATRDPVTIQVQEPGGQNAVELRPGVLIDTGRRVAYVMHPKGGIDAIGLARGELQWHSDAAAKPLALAGNVLVAQVEPARQTNQLTVAALDARSGKRTTSGSLPVTDGAQVTIDDTAEGSFAIRARATPREAMLSWEYSRFPLQGDQAGRSRGRDGARHARGQRRAASNSAGHAGIGRQSEIRPHLGTARRRGGRDGSHASTRRRASSRAPGIGLWRAVRVGRRPSHSEQPARFGRPHVGQIPMDRLRARDGEAGRIASRLPVTRAVRGGRRADRVQVGPYVRRTAGGLVEQPLQIRAVSLATGNEQWSRPVRDTTYRGPLPG